MHPALSHSLVATRRAATARRAKRRRVPGALVPVEAGDRLRRRKRTKRFRNDAGRELVATELRQTRATTLVFARAREDSRSEIASGERVVDQDYPTTSRSDLHVRRRFRL